MDKRNDDPCTLSRFILDEFRGGDQDMSFIMNAISVAAKVIANAVQHAGIRPLSELHGMFRGPKSEGRSYSQLDELAGDVLLNALRYSQQVGLIFLDGHENPVSVPSENGAAPKKYAVVSDPLDGSMNITSNISVGTTFGVYKSSGGAASLADILQAGNRMKVAGYILYGSATVMMFTSGKGVHMFVMDPDYGEFVMTRRNVTIPNPAAQIYAINSGNSEVWDRATREFIRWTKCQAAPYSARYVGSMVSDVHRTLLCGGVFMYPSDKRTVTGKLRLLCECFPLSMLVEQAGGLATTGMQRILDVVPRDIHEKSSIFLGCKRDVDQVTLFYSYYGAAYEDTPFNAQQQQQPQQPQQQQPQQQQQQQQVPQPLLPPPPQQQQQQQQPPQQQQQQQQQQQLPQPPQQQPQQQPQQVSQQLPLIENSNSSMENPKRRKF